MSDPNTSATPAEAVPSLLAQLSPENRTLVERFLKDPTALAVPPVESPFFASMLEDAQLDPDVVRWAREFERDGYVVLEDFIDPALIEAICDQLPWLFDPKTKFDAERFVQDLLKMDTRRRQDAWWVSEPIKQLACDNRILELLELFYGRKAIPFQTLNFLHGTEQATHSDAIHFSSLPARFMCGVWVALEDITEDNGPLHYYPGSHKLPDTRLEEMGLWGHPGISALSEQYTLYENYLRALIHAKSMPQKRLIAKKGTALIWSNGLLHGGSPINDPNSTRLSQVTHYYFENCVYWAPINSNAALGEYRLKDIHDLRTRELLPHTLNGEPLDLEPVANFNHRIGRAGSFGKKKRR